MRQFSWLEQLRLCQNYVFKYPRISRFLHKDPAEISSYQLEQLRELIRLAYEHTKFYRRLYAKHDIHPDDIRTWSDFQKLPLITKSEIIANQADCIVDT